jgi:CBS domain-containing protein
VDEGGRLVGIVTVDHLIDILLEKYGPRKIGGGVDLSRRRADREHREAARGT